MVHGLATSVLSGILLEIQNLKLQPRPIKLESTFEITLDYIKRGQEEEAHLWDWRQMINCSLNQSWTGENSKVKNQSAVLTGEWWHLLVRKQIPFLSLAS